VSVPFSTQQFEEKPSRYMPRTRVRIDKVVATQNKLDPVKVAAIARKPAEAVSPAPLVHKHQGKYFVSDGHHRVAGAIERGDTHIWVKRVR
jgi:ParB-like chromosome segregation protein Spo0J